jgi:hypothetical protein
MRSVLNAFVSSALMLSALVLGIHLARLERVAAVRAIFEQELVRHEIRRIELTVGGML